MTLEVTSPSESFVTAVMPGVDVVHNLARRLTRRRADTEDLLQETLERAWTAWQRGVRPESLNAWLSTICLNLARDRARQKGRVDGTMRRRTQAVIPSRTRRSRR